MTFPIHIEVRFSANPLDKTLFSASNTLSYGNLRFLHGLDFAEVERDLQRAIDTGNWDSWYFESDLTEVVDV